MKIDREEVRRVARLASLELDEVSLDRMAKEMSEILDYVDQIRDIDMSAVLDEAGGPGAPLREDAVHAFEAPDPISNNAPAVSHGHFVVPKVIGGDS